MSNLTLRAERLDNFRAKGIAERLTLDEAQNIVSVWGVHLEHSGFVMFLFGINIPESLLPYPIDILQGALIKLQAFYYKQGKQDKVKFLKESEMLLMQYCEDKEAINEVASKFTDKKWQEAMIPAVQDLQKSQAQNGFLVNKELWKLSKTRIEELQKNLH